MTDARAIVSLAQIEDKLRRALGLAGEVGLQFTPDMLPAIVVGDATKIGNATIRGRRFAFSWGFFNFAAAGTLGLKASADIVIEGILCSAQTTAQQWSIRQFTPDAADPITMATVAVPWIERPTNASDFAPVLTCAAAPQADVATGNCVWASSAPNAGAALCSFPIFVGNGGKLIIREQNVVTNASVSFWGYVF